MRWFFLFVLALNLSYISWHLLSEPAPYADVPPLKKDIERIVLLGERNAADSKQVSTPAAESQQDKPGQSEEAGQSVLQLANVTDRPAVNKASASKPSDASNGTTQTAASTQVAVKQDKPAAEKTEIEKVQTEPAQSEARAGTAAMKHAGNQPMGEENCYTLGPFRDLDALRSLTRDIKSYVVSADFRGEEVNEQSSYWVFIRPVKTEDQARKLAARLKDNKITDFYIIRKGEQKYGISLGRFRNKASAYGLAKKVSKLNFDVAVEPVFKDVTYYWLDYQLSKDANIPKAVFDRYIDGKSADFTRKSRVCS